MSYCCTPDLSPQAGQAGCWRGSTGLDRGLGFEVCRQFGERGYRVVLTGPDRKKREASAAKLRSSGSDVVYHQLDVVDEKSVQALRKFVIKKFNRIDVLVNNAGVLLDEGRSGLEGILARRLRKRPKRVGFGEGPGVLDVNIGIVRAALEINTLGALRMCQAFMPLMIKNGYGRGVNVSSSRGQMSGMTDEGAPEYQMSKAALNAVTHMAAMCR